MRYGKAFKDALEIQSSLAGLKSANAKERFQAIHDLLGAISHFVEKRNGPHVFIRARRADKPCNSEIRLPMHLSYNPNPGLGRANLDGVPVFYGCDTPAIALLEVEAKPKEEFYISKWRHSGPINTAIYSHNCKTSAEHIVKLQARVDQALTSMQISGTGQDLLEDCTNMFRDPDTDNYVLSSLLAHYLFNEKDIEAIEYLSVKLSAGLNYALPTSVADKLQLDKAIRIRVDDEGRYTPLFLANLAGNEIAWTQITSQTPECDWQLVSKNDINARQLL